MAVFMQFNKELKTISMCRSALSRLYTLERFYCHSYKEINFVCQNDTSILVIITWLLIYLLSLSSGESPPLILYLHEIKIKI